jgi:hypothetical protein
VVGSLEVAAPGWQEEGGERRAVREEAVRRAAGAEAEEGPIPEGEEAEGRTTYLEMTGFEMGRLSKMSWTRRARSRSLNNRARVAGGGFENLATSVLWVDIGTTSHRFTAMIVFVVLIDRARDWLSMFGDGKKSTSTYLRDGGEQARQLELLAPHPCPHLMLVPHTCMRPVDAYLWPSAISPLTEYLNMHATYGIVCIPFYVSKLVRTNRVP